MVKATIIAGLVALAFLPACDKIETEQNAPTMVVAAPSENALVTVGDTLFMKVDYADDATLTDYTVNIRNINTDVNSFSYSQPIGESTASLDTFKIMPDTGHYELLLYVADNHDNFTNKVINFTVVP